MINENIPKISTIIIGGMIILFSWIFPIITMLPAKTILFQEKNTIVFGSSFDSYVLCIIAFILIGLSLILIFNKKKAVKVMSVMFLFIGVASFYFSTNEYFMLKANGLYIKPLTETGKAKELQWDDMKEVVYTYDQGRTKRKHVEIIMKNGESNFIDLNGDSLEMKPYIKSELAIRGGKVYDKEEDTP